MAQLIFLVSLALKHHLFGRHYFQKYGIKNFW